MALDFLKLIDAKLADVFHKKAHDPSKARQRAIKSVDTSMKQFEENPVGRGRKKFKLNNSVVEFTPGFEMGSAGLTAYVPSERFADFLKGLKSSIQAGELDKELEAAESGDTGKRSDAGRVRKPRGPLSEEALAARRAKMAANKAK